MGNGIIQHSRPTIGQEEELAVLEVLRSGNIAQGKKVEEFENKLANYIGRKFGIAVNSGLSALHLALIAIGVSENDKVVLPSYTCDALLQAVFYLRAKPIIVDVNYEDGNISFASTMKILNKERNIKAIIIPHMFGFPAEIGKFMTLDIPIIEDCAVAVGGEYKNRKLGNFGNLSIFSFYATKMITTGEGGMILTDDENLADFLRDIRDYTRHEEFGIRYNYKLTDVQAAMGLEQLKKLDAFVAKRKRLFKYYCDLLKNQPGIELPCCNFESHIKPSYYRFIVKLEKNPKEIQNNLAKKGIMCGRGVLMPLHKLLKLNSRDYPNSENLYNKSLSLPLYPSLEFQDIDYVVSNLILEVNK